MNDDLVTLLRAQSFATVGQRIFAVEVAQEAALPFVVVLQTNTEHNNSLDGAGGTEFAGIEIVAKSNSPSEAKSIGKAVKAFIRNYSGPMGTITCKAVLLEDEFPGSEKPTANGAVRYTYTVAIEVQYQ